MTIINPPGFNRTFSKWEDIADYLLIEHHPDGPADKAELERASADMRWDCPGCDVPITQQSVLVHYPCLVDDNDRAPIPSLKSQNGIEGICPICGETNPTPQSLQNHIENHDREVVISTLSSTGQCEVCGENLQLSDNLDSHQSCIVSRAVENISYGGNSSGRNINCPVKSCSDSTSNRGSMLWHLWEAHFETNGFTGDCPGCKSELSFGNVQNHILHLGPLNKAGGKN
jgi:hypothetical protein